MFTSSDRVSDFFSMVFYKVHVTHVGLGYIGYSLYGRDLVVTTFVKIP